MNTSREILQRLGGIKEAVEYSTGLSRYLWNLFLDHADKKRRSNVLNVEAAILAYQPSHCDQYPEGVFPKINELALDFFRQSGAFPGSNRQAISPDFFNLFDLSNSLLASNCNVADLSYFVMRNIRTKYEISYSPIVADAFRVFTTTISSGTNGLQRSQLAYSELKQILRSRIVANSPLEGSNLVNSFLESCIACHELVPLARLDGRVIFTNDRINPSKLLSKLFGLKTSIPGFDKLFHDSGIVFPEKQSFQSDSLRGKIALIEGRFGTGKSLLAAQLCVEVARKGGLAWYFSLEQTVPEVCFLLRTMGLVDSGFHLIDDPIEIPNISKLKKGVLVVQRLRRHDLNTTLKFVETYVGGAKNDFPVELICIDPFNEISGGTPFDSENLTISARPSNAEPTTTNFSIGVNADLRDVATNSFERIKNKQSNLILVTEESEEFSETRRFFSHISDLKIRLSIDGSKHDYSKRYLEIEKSRLQVEQRGRHDFSIKSGEGIHVYPTSAAVRAGNQVKYITSNQSQNLHSFGLSSVDRVLGGASVQSGDNLLMSGPIGTLKTHLSIIFLLETESTNKRSPTDVEYLRNRGVSKVGIKRPTGLFVSMRYDQSRIDQLRSSNLIKNSLQGIEGKDWQSKSIEVCPIPGGYATPGVIYERIDSTIDRIRRSGGEIDRAVLDDITVWENLCPFVQDDPTFVNTIIDLLQRKGITVLATHTNHQVDNESFAHQSLVEVSDTNLELSIVDYQGQQRILIRALRSRMAGRIREAFELKMDEQLGIDIERAPSLLRLGADGILELIPICLFVQAEASSQINYVRDICESLKAYLATDVSVVPQELIESQRSFSTSSFAATNELQILQLDEFQLVAEGRSEGLSKSLAEFDQMEFGVGEFHEFGIDIRELGTKTRKCDDNGGPDETSILAIPYYDNLSCLVISDLFWGKAAKAGFTLRKTTPSWPEIANASTAIHSLAKNENEDGGKVFDFPNESEENLICLFLEILFSLFANNSNDNFQLEDYLNKDFLELIGSDQFVLAVQILSRLCWNKDLTKVYEPFSFDNDQEGDKKYWSDRSDAYAVKPEALIWRHWFTTYRAMVSTSASNGSDLKCFALPGGLTTAGQWYLGIPNHSAVPQVGFEIIKLLTTRDEELKRMRSGVGLPVREAFVQKSRKRDLSVGLKIIDNGQEFFGSLKHQCKQSTIRRSQIKNYHRCSPVVAAFLRSEILLVSIDKRTQAPTILNEGANKLEIRRIKKNRTQLVRRCKALVCIK